MKLALIFAAFGLSLAPAMGQEIPSSSQPVLSMADASQPDVRQVWSREAGRLDAGESQARVVAVVIQRVGNPVTARGVQVELTGRNWKSAFSIDEAHVPAILRILHGLDRDVQQAGGILARGILGSCEFRDHPEYRFTADYDFGTHPAGLRLNGLVFSQRRPDDFAQVLAQALDSLRRLPDFQ